MRKIIIISAICALIFITFIAINSIKIPSPSKLNKYTISTGGGLVIKNLDKLKISFNIYLYCSLDILTQRASRNNLRPLLNEDTSSQMKNLFNERKDIYNKAADITINATINPKNTINKILKEINNDN